MKNVWLATAGGLTASAVIAAAGIAGPLASASAAGAPCTAKTPTIQGHPAMAFCGPATVTLTVAHKTYAFHNGFCAEPIPHSDAFQLSVGTDVPTLGGPNNNAGQPVFSMDFAKAHTTASIADAYFAGHEILANT